MALSGFGTRLPTRADERSKDELDSRAHTVNALADRHGGMKDAIHDVSVETGVPTRNNSKRCTSGILMPARPAF